METRHLTPRQLLILVLTACRDAGYEVIPKQRVFDAIRELRAGKPSWVPELTFILSGMRHCCADLEEALNGLHPAGVIVFNPVGGTITIAESMSSAEVYKPLFEAERESLAEQMTPYIGEFVRLVTRPDPNATKKKPDPRFS